MTSVTPNAELKIGAPQRTTLFPSKHRKKTAARPLAITVLQYVFRVSIAKTFMAGSRGLSSLGDKRFADAYAQVCFDVFFRDSINCSVIKYHRSCFCHFAIGLRSAFSTLRNASISSVLACAIIGMGCA